MSDYDPAAYGDAWSREYDRLYGARDDPAVVVAALGRLTQGRSVLELGIGTGRLAIPLHDRGWRVVGVESSDKMIAELRGRLAEREVGVHRGDMRSIQLDERFDAVVIVFSTLFLLPDQESQIACLETACRHLAPNGVVVVESFVPDHTRWSDGKRVALSRWTETGVEIETAQHDRAAQTIDVRYLLFEADGRHVRPLRLRYAWPAEIDLMARIAGLELLDRWSDWEGHRFAPTSGSHVSVFRRRSEGASGGDYMASDSG